MTAAAAAVWDAAQSIVRTAILSLQADKLTPAKLATRVVIAAGEIGTPPT